MRNGWLIIFASVTLLLFVHMAVPITAQQSGQPVRVGVVLALTGPVAALGDDALRGIRLAADEIRTKGGLYGGRPVELVILDDQGRGDIAVLSLERLILRERVLAVIGGSFGTDANAILPIAERAGIPLLTPTGITIPEQQTPQRFRHGFFFLVNQTDASHALLEYATKKLNTPRIGLLRLIREFGQIGSRELNRLAPEYGAQIVAEELGNDPDTDFTAQLTRIRAARPQALIIWMSSPAGALAIRNARQLGLDIPILGITGLGTKPLFDIGGRDAEDVIIQSLIAGGDPLPRQRTFVELFRRAHNRVPEPIEAAGYDALKALAKAYDSAAQAGAVTPRVLRDAIERTVYDGAGTVIRFSPNKHEPERASIVMIQVKGGKFVRAP